MRNHYSKITKCKLCVTSVADGPRLKYGSFKLKTGKKIWHNTFKVSEFQWYSRIHSRTSAKVPRTNTFVWVSGVCNIAPYHHMCKFADASNITVFPICVDVLKTAENFSEMKHFSEEYVTTNIGWDAWLELHPQNWSFPLPFSAVASQASWKCAYHSITVRGHCRAGETGL